MLKPGFLSSGATRPAFQADGKRPALKDMLAMCAMMAENSALHDLTHNLVVDLMARFSLVQT